MYSGTLCILDVCKGHLFVSEGGGVLCYYRENLTAARIWRSTYYIRFFVKILIETNVNISNELILSDGYRSVNYTALLAKLTHLARDPM